MRISDWSSDVCSSDLMALEPMTVAVEEGPNPELVDMGRRFWISAVLTLPLFIMAMSDMLPGKPAAGLFAGEAGLWIRSEEHTSELQSLMRISSAVFCLTKKIIQESYTLIFITSTSISVISSP